VPVLQQHHLSSFSWGIWKINESWEELLLQLERQDIYFSALNRYKSESRKAEWLAVRVLLKTLTGKELNISYHENGSPFLIDIPLYISISHTKGYAAVILSPQQPVGIDIEYHAERIHRIKSRFLSDAEFKLPGINLSTDNLLVCWSAKETAFKMLGQQSADPQTDLQIIDFQLIGENRIITVREHITPQSLVFHIHYAITPDFVVTHCHVSA
jgi:phosphopantetheinyl transferase